MNCNLSIMPIVDGRKRPDFYRMRPFDGDHELGEHIGDVLKSLREEGITLDTHIVEIGLRFA